MTTEELEALFRELAPPTPGALSARRVGAGSIFRVARQSDGAPALLVRIDVTTAVPPANARLANLNYLPRERLRIDGLLGSTEEAVHTVLPCASPDEDLRHYFFRVVAALIDELGPEPSATVVDDGVARLLELFRALERPARRSLQGVWAELLLIARSHNATYAVSAWHSDPDAIHDFVAGADVVEVKSTQGSIRSHHFRLEQLRPSPGGMLVVASLMLTPSDDGVSIADLVKRISARLPEDTEHRARLEAIVAASLGSDWRLTLQTRFDEDAAASSIRCFPADSIPSVAQNVPVEVSEVRFVVDLSGVPPREQSHCGVPLFDALLPHAGGAAPIAHDR